VAVALQQEKLIVSPAVKFFVRRRTKRQSYEEWQDHGYEVDLVAANAQKLVLATVKSFFGSLGVQAREVTGESGNTGAYRLLNEPSLRSEVIQSEADTYGYETSRVFLRLYAGRFRQRKGGDDRPAIEKWCEAQGVIGGGPIQVFGVEQVVEMVRQAPVRKTYVDNPVIAAMKVLEAAGQLSPLPSTGQPP
jgi:hypothetical protein